MADRSLQAALDKETIQSLWKQVERSRKELQLRYKERWDKNLRLYLGDHWFDDLYDDEEDGQFLPAGLKTMTVNQIGAGIKIKHASDTAVVPQFDVTPDDPTVDQGQLNLRMTLSAYITKNFEGSSGCWMAARAAWLDYLIFGTCMVGTGWREGDEEPSAIDEGSLQERAAHEANLQAMYESLASNPGIVASALTPPEATDEVRISGEGQIGFRISPYNVIVDPDVTWDQYQNARFVGFTSQMTRGDLEAAYPKADLSGVSGYTSTAGDNESKFVLDPEEQWKEGVEAEGDDQRLVPIVEVWFRSVAVAKGFTAMDGDVEREYPDATYALRVKWAVEQPDEPLAVELWPYDLRDDEGRRTYPFHFSFNREVPGAFFAQGDPEIGQFPQHALNLTRSLELTHINQVRPKYQAQKGELDGDAKDALQSEEVGIIVQTKSPAAAEPIRPIPRDPVAAEFQPAIERAMEDINSLSGVNDAARGVPIPGDHTATEARLEAQLSSGRSAEEAAKFEDLCVWLASMCWQLKCEMGSAGDRVRVQTIPQGVPMGHTPTQPTIQVKILTQDMLVPVTITLTTGATRVQDENQQLERTITFGQQVLAIGGFYYSQPTPFGGPWGFVSPRYYIRLVARKAKLDQNMEPLFDLSQEPQPAPMAPPPGGPMGLPPPGGPGQPQGAPPAPTGFPQAAPLPPGGPLQPTVKPVAPTLEDMIANGGVNR